MCYQKIYKTLKTRCGTAETYYLMGGFATFSETIPQAVNQPTSAAPVLSKRVK